MYRLSLRGASAAQDDTVVFVQSEDIVTLMVPQHSTQAKTTTITAHRGAQRRFPENSVAAIKEAINIAMEHPEVGFFIEADVRHTADHQLVIMHDSDVARTTYGTGRVEEQTAAQIATLQVRPLSDILPAAAHCPGRVREPFLAVTQDDFRVPSLSDALDLLNQANKVRAHEGLPMGLALQIKQERKAGSLLRTGVAVIRSGLSELLDALGLTTSADIIYPASDTSKLLAYALNARHDRLPPMLIYSGEGLAGKRDLEATWLHLDKAAREHIDPQHLGAVNIPILLDGHASTVSPWHIGAVEYSKRLWALGGTPTQHVALNRDTEASIASAITHGADIIIGDYPERMIAALKAHQAEQDASPTPADFRMQEIKRRGTDVDQQLARG